MEKSWKQTVYREVSPKYPHILRQRATLPRHKSSLCVNLINPPVRGTCEGRAVRAPARQSRNARGK